MRLHVRLAATDLSPGGEGKYIFGTEGKEQVMVVDSAVA